MEFQKRKTAAMADLNSPAPDKSPKGNIDTPIIPLLNVINGHPSYFTTSSCSGRISILSQDAASPSTAKKKSGGGFWLFVSHEPVQPQALSNLLFPPPGKQHSVGSAPISGGILVFRFEPLIIAAECETLGAAQRLVSLAVSCGFRESGITSTKKRVIVAIRCSIRLEVPLGTGERLMVSPEFLEYLVQVANEKMEANRQRTHLFLNKLVSAFDSSQQNDSASGDVGINSDTIIEAKNNIGSLRSSEAALVRFSTLELVGEPVERLFLWGHSACTLYGKKIVVFGGFGGLGRHARKNDLFVLDADSRSVETIDGGPGAPLPRLGHTCSAVGDSVYAIGGRADPLNILNEIWVFDYEKRDWMLLRCGGSFFPPRHRHAAVAVGSKIYVYGGIDNDGVLSSLYALDTISLKWSEMETRGDQPGPCHSHSMVADGSNSLYLFGGFDGDRALGDLFRFDIRRSQWSRLKTSGKSPNARFSHSMFIYSDRLFVFGGCPLRDECRELFLLDLRNLSWKRMTMETSSSSGGGALFVRSAANVVGDDLIVIGGGASCYAFGTKFSAPMRCNLSQMELPRAREFEAIPVPRVVRLKKEYAKSGKDVLKRFGWLDLGRRVYSEDGGSYIRFPVTAEFCALLEEDDHDEELITARLSANTSSSVALDLLAGCGATELFIDEVVEARKKSTSPYRVMREGVATLLRNHGLPLKLLEQLPSRWEKLGDMIVLPVGSFNDRLWDTMTPDELWSVVARSLGTDRLARQGRVAGNGTRDSNLEIVRGKDGWVEHRENNGIVYRFDSAKCMFSWGNASEKLRMARLDCGGEVVVDLFAGIGYFVLPFLVR
ncbi:hypothetical protein M569_16919 [Genlisea aurea]|uniref:tRNA wybutosine-synthesizing protein 3 n=1 Tax=Genlisea aurea TaxID=192259 RepID=S8D5K8_9LAMI|nr:hypothetical protein M569_16919 [Genlisea aurea]